MFFDAIETGARASPGFAEGYRVQLLIDAARRSHQQGKWIDVTHEAAKEGARA
jgi:predicted dehydrogenase